MAVITQTAPGQLLRGTTGNDTFYVNYLPVYIQDYLPSTDVIISSVSLDLEAGGGGGGGYLGIDAAIEAVSLTGGANLTLAGHANSSQSLYGNDGDNTINARDRNDTIFGGAGNDSLFGTGYGNKYFDGGPGIDTMRGSGNNDTYIVDRIEDLVIDSGGIDTVYYPASLEGGIVKHSFIENWIPLGSDGASNPCGQYICASIIPGQVYTAIIGKPFSQQILFDGTGGVVFSPPPSWHPNQLPAWMSVSAQGVVSGTPNAIEQNRIVALSVTGPQNGSIGTSTLNVIEPPPPTLEVSSASLSGFSSNFGSPSSSQPIGFSGAGLTNGVVVAASSGFEISGDGVSFFQQLNFAQTDGDAGATIQVRVSSGTAVGALSGQLTVSSSGATSRQVALSGEVLPALTRPVTFSVNLNILIAFGQFNPAFHTVQVRGDFNNFDGWDLADDNLDGIYSGTFTISGAQGLSQNFKFFIPTLLPSPWESIPDRTFALGAANTAQILDTVYFNNKETLPGVILETSAPSALYVGTAAVSRIHLGEDQVFP